jgi:hypothetical protein
MNDDIPIIGQKEPELPEVEGNFLFSVALLFINHSKEVRAISFNCPPGVYPNPEWAPTLIAEASREGLRALKLETKDLSWRKPTPTEFVQISTRNPKAQAKLKYAEPFSVQLEVDKEETPSDNHSDGR